MGIASANAPDNRLRSFGQTREGDARAIGEGGSDLWPSSCHIALQMRSREMTFRVGGLRTKTEMKPGSRGAALSFSFDVRDAFPGTYRAASRIGGYAMNHADVSAIKIYLRDSEPRDALEVEI